MSWKKLGLAKELKGSWRRSRTQYLSRGNDCPTSSSLWFRGSLATQTCGRNESVHVKSHAGKILAGTRECFLSAACSRWQSLTLGQAIDVGTALSLMLEDDNTASEIFELYGPTNYSMAELAELVDKEIYKRRRHLNIPKPLLKPAAGYLNRFLWWKTTSADEVEREFLDQEIDPKAKTFKDLGMEPAELKNYTFHYLVSSSSDALVMEKPWIDMSGKF